LQSDPDPRELDVVVSTGEQVTIGLLAMALQEIGVPAHSYCGWQVRVSTDSSHGKARIQSIDEEEIRSDLDSGKVVIVAGFQGVDEFGHITTLGRGGSDTSAVAMAAALNADECQIYTDVDGVYTTDPRVVPEARRLKTITFEEMMEMASLGSKVLQIRSVEFAGKYKVRLRVLSSFDENEGEGTLITFEGDNMEKAVVAGIAFDRNEARINVKGVPDKPGIAYQILGPISDANIEVDMIIQNVGENGTTDFSFTVPRGEYQHSMQILRDVQNHIGAAKIDTNDKVAKVSIVGVGMRSHCGIASTMFRTLAEEGINITMISTSEIKVSVLIDEKYLELAVRVLHKAFGLDQEELSV
jgi:aspartate kinase